MLIASRPMTSLLLSVLVCFLVVSTNSDSIFRSKRQAGRTITKWPNATVYYWYGNISYYNRLLIDRVLPQITSKTCLKFVKNQNVANYIQFVNVTSKTGCASSHIGMDSSGQQIIYVGTGCLFDGQILRAVMNAIGFYPMEIRNDRNTYLTFNFESINPEFRDGLKALNGSTVQNFQQPYNYGSVLHSGYDEYLYADSTTYPMMSKQFDYYMTMGGALMTSYDYKLINFMYGCLDACGDSIKSNCRNYGHANPVTCNKCNCPLGYAGGYCTAKPSDNAPTVIANNSWQTLKLRIGATRRRELPGSYIIKTAWIKKPDTFEYLQIKYVKVESIQSVCTPGCRYYGFEIKYMKNQDVASPRICCDAFKNAIVVSALTTTPIVAYTSTVAATLTIQYRAVHNNVTKAITTKSLPPQLTTETPYDVCPGCPNGVGMAPNRQAKTCNNKTITTTYGWLGNHDDEYWYYGCMTWWFCENQSDHVYILEENNKCVEQNSNALGLNCRSKYEWTYQWGNPNSPAIKRVFCAPPSSTL